jgi:hypothetical protein
MDARHLCADARFCDPNGKVWTQVARTDDPEVRAMFLSQVHNCPAGRLLAFDKAAGKTIEQHSPLAIGLIEDPVEDCSGPIWLRGGVVLTSADGHQHEKRNNMTVCPCVSEFQGKYESLALPLEYCPGVAAARTSFRLQKWTLWHTSIQDECHDDP